MNWYYVEDGRQAGPVEEAQLSELVQSGRIQPGTLVWHEGMSAWTPYREVAPESIPAPAAAPLGMVDAQAGAGGVVCGECGRSFPPTEVIRYGDKFICAGCKPAFFQRLREGASLAGLTSPGMATEAEILARDYEVDIGGCLTRAWELFKANAGIMIGVTVLVYMAILAANLVPYLSILLSIFLNGPLAGGLWLFYIRLKRGQNVGVGDAFGGFGPRYWQLVLTQLIPGLITGAIAAALMMVLVVPAILLSNHGGSSGISTGFIAVMAVAVILVMAVVFYLNTCWIFALALAADKGLKFWPALELSRKVVNKHWGMTFGLLVVCGCVALVGVIACLVGVLVTGPVAITALVCHYEKVFGDLAPSMD